MIVNALPEKMQQQGISIRELARRTGVTYTTIRAVYHGERRSVKLDVLDAICQTMHLQPGEIYRFVGPGEMPTDVGSVPPETQVVERTSKPKRRTSKSSPGGSDAWVTWE
ncbi:MAG TPA: helix-turn-helix transcriptional regulator [candidate division Zixibacteria bacterium]|nr:helix-turn-helix transcriptional regulator [candidate division Zixibacteria bacterium]